MVDKDKFGERRTCPICGAKFYDMHRDPPTCPKCGTDASNPLEPEEVVIAEAEEEIEDEEELEELDEKDLEVSDLDDTEDELDDD